MSSIDSTNEELLRRARRGDPGGVVLVADEQTAGRGRLGRRWEAVAGSSLLVSVLLRPLLAPADAHLATVCAALAAVEACEQVASVRPGIKWPNDLVVGDRKLAGLLAESVVTAGGVTGGRLDALVVGMGLNVRWPRPMPGELAAIATALNHEAAPGRVFDRDAVLEAWLAALDRLLTELVTGDGRRALAERHRAACVTVGRRVQVERGQPRAERDRPGGPDVVEGTAVELTDDGRLVVDDGVVRHVISVGDVVHLRALV